MWLSETLIPWPARASLISFSFAFGCDERWLRIASAFDGPPFCLRLAMCRGPLGVERRFASSDMDERYPGQRDLTVNGPPSRSTLSALRRPCAVGTTEVVRSRPV